MGLHKTTHIRQNDRRDTKEGVLKYVAPSAFFVKPTNVEALVAEMDAYNVAAAETDAGYDLWAFWYDSRLKLPAWYIVAKDVALIQPSSAFMERVLSTLRACLDSRQEKCYLGRIAASALLKYNRASEEC